MRVFSNLAISLDGKIATRKRELFLLGTRRDHQEMQRLRKQADIILIGATTLRSYKKPNLVFQQTHQPLNAIVSSNLEAISPQWPFFTETRTQRVLFVGSKTSVQRIRKFEKASEIVVLKAPTKKSTVAHQIIRWCESRKLQNLLVEGGGGVMWDFVSTNLIDDYHVTLTPKLIGGSGAATLVDGAGFLAQDILSLKLVSCRVEGDEIFLVYQRKGR